VMARRPPRAGREAPLAPRRVPAQLSAMRRLHRWLFSLAGFVSIAVSAPRAAEAGFARVAPQWRDAEAFDRISEYLGGGENTGGQIIRRTHTDVRAGYYFLVRVNNPAAFAGAKFVLNVIRPDVPEPQTFTFPAAAPAGATSFQLGLTGADWPGGKKALPIAWRLQLLAADGRVLATQRSFLWEMPAK
jgi:hypothetical protein